jgi:hypothetical protein
MNLTLMFKLGLPMFRESPSMTNLVLVRRGEKTGPNKVLMTHMLDTYCANLGQLVSVAKSSIFFSPNINVDVRVEICNTLNIYTEALSDKYLGLPDSGGEQIEVFALCGKSNAKN